jgi:hypothetical protein
MEFKTRKERYTYIVNLRNQRYTLREIGEQLGITRERVRQLANSGESFNCKKCGRELLDGELRLCVDCKKLKEKQDKLFLYELRKKYNSKNPIISPIDYLSVGSADKLGGGRNRYREAIRARDNWTCQLCGKKWESGTVAWPKRFDVHHLEEKMDGKTHTKGCYQYDVANPDKLVTLCHKCHTRLSKEQNKFLAEKISKIYNEGDNSSKSAEISQEKITI